MVQDPTKFTSLDDWLKEEGIYEETVAAAKARITPNGHTQGPWAVFADEKSIIIATADGSTRIARLMSANGKDLENSHLIAAAPILAAALIEAREVVADYKENANTQSAKTFSIDLIKQIDEALSYSTGNGIVTEFANIAPNKPV